MTRSPAQLSNDQRLADLRGEAGVIARGNVLDAITALTDQYGFPPTLKELGQACGCNASTTHAHLINLREAGLVTWRPNCSRTIRVTNAP